MAITIEGTLPVAIAVLNGQETLKLKKVRLETLTVADALRIQSGLKPEQYVGVAEICAQTRLVEEDGSMTHPLDYETLLSSSKQNLDYLSELKVALDAKEKAES